MNLILNLGHNSAAIGITALGAIVGYEEERLTRIKSSSAFPAWSVHKILDHLENNDDGSPRNLYVSHWFDDFNFHRSPPAATYKYYSPDIVKALIRRGFKVNWLSPEMTHHDAHAHSAVAFFLSHAEQAHLKSIVTDNAHVIVCDGFGNRQEVFSVYLMRLDSNGRPSIHLLHRIHGYQQSLGLLYQHATSFCGMTENQDEYKFLGYESHVGEELTTKNMDAIIEAAAKKANEIYAGTITQRPDSEFIDVGHLTEVKQKNHKEFSKIVETIENSDLRKIRCAIGYYIQNVLEIFYEKILRSFDVKHALLAGGVHYNVKLNNHVLKSIPGLVSVVPLAGDQGTGLGLYAGMGGRLRFNSLLWGSRNLNPKFSQLESSRMLFFNSRDKYVNAVSELLHQNKIVNTITGPMEFGPRALCNTSTLALPTADNVSTINAINGRDMVMPFAGVMLEENISFFHRPIQYERVVGSLQYMIMTLDYDMATPSDFERYAGIAHSYPAPRNNKFSGRPQVINFEDNRPIRQILKNLDVGNVKAIINTSLNVHGVPIVYSLRDAIDDMQFNVQKSKQLGLEPPVLVIGTF
jgi:carbamoyltransferase